MEEAKRMIRTAVIGAGHWGPNLITNFHTSDRSRVVRVVDRDTIRLETVSRRFPGIAFGTDAAEVFGDPEVDAVVVATPTSTHFELARQALEAGKHVLVEKPMADSVARCEVLCELAEKANRILMVGHVFIYNDAAEQVKEYIRAGTLGRIYYISMVRTNLGPIRVDVDAAWDLAAHDISLASHWLDSWPRSVSAMGGSWINDGIADAVFATLRYPNEVIVNLHASWLNPRKAREITVVGESKMLTFDDVNLSEPLRIYDKQVTTERSEAAFVDDFSAFRMVVREGDIHVPHVSMSQPLKNECEHFLDCVIDGNKPRSGGAEGLAVVKTLEAISASREDNGSQVEVGL